MAKCKNPDKSEDWASAVITASDRVDCCHYVLSQLPTHDIHNPDFIKKMDRVGAPSLVRCLLHSTLFSAVVLALAAFIVLEFALPPNALIGLAMTESEASLLAQNLNRFS